MRTGPIEEIKGKPLAEFVSPASSQIIRVEPSYLKHKDGPKHAYYNAEWIKSPLMSEDDRRTESRKTVGNLLQDRNRDLSQVERYTSYTVRVRLQGKERNYRALTLHYGAQPQSGKPGAEILDNTTIEMNAVLADRSPRVRSPWKEYVKSGLYLAVVNEVLGAEGNFDIRADAVLGYLPGDDAVPERLPSNPALLQLMFVPVDRVTYIEHIVAPFTTDWGAMVPRTPVLAVDIEVRLVCNTEWRCSVNKADSDYNIFYRLIAGVSEASVAAATAANHCDMIRDLNALGNVAGVRWYMVRAVELSTSEAEPCTCRSRFVPPFRGILQFRPQSAWRILHKA